MTSVRSLTPELRIAALALVVVGAVLASSGSAAGQAGVEPRIVGGTEATPGEFPFAALVHSGPYLCGGSVLDQDHVLTAAHCVTINAGPGPGNWNTRPATQVDVIVGRHDRTTTDGQVIEADAITVHPSHDASTLHYDVAVITLSESIIEPGVSGVALAGDSSLETPGATATAIGWGTLSYGGPTSDTLQKVDLPLVADGDCSGIYGGFFSASLMLCAGDLVNGGIDSCQGDSGGPLLRDNGGTPTQVGIVSWGAECAAPGEPGVYTRVSAVSSWIQSVVGGASGGGPTCNGLPATHVGTNGADTIIGTSGDDVIVAKGGDDFIKGRGGDDVICTGSGDDEVRAGGGNDLVFGQGGKDVLRGGSGNDELRGGDSRDILKGQKGDDTLIGEGGNRDKAVGSGGFDTCDAEREKTCEA